MLRLVHAWCTHRSEMRAVTWISNSISTLLYAIADPSFTVISACPVLSYSWAGHSFSVFDPMFLTLQFVISSALQFLETCSAVSQTLWMSQFAFARNFRKWSHSHRWSPRSSAAVSWSRVSFHVASCDCVPYCQPQYSNPFPSLMRICLFHAHCWRLTVSHCWDSWLLLVTHVTLFLAHRGLWTPTRGPLHRLCAMMLTSCYHASTTPLPCVLHWANNEPLRGPAQIVPDSGTSVVGKRRRRSGRPSKLQWNIEQQHHFRENADSHTQTRHELVPTSHALVKSLAQLSRVLKHEKMCVCGASGEVSCLHPPSRARHSRMSVREICEKKFRTWKRL